MGCGDSKIDNPSSEQEPNREVLQNSGIEPVKRTKFSPNKGPTQAEDDAINIEPNPTRKKKATKGKSIEANLFQENQEKQNLMKVKKAKELQSMPEQQKFISDIVKKSRAKLAAIVPASEFEKGHFSKPVVEYSPQKRGNILAGESTSKGKSQWSRPIAGDPKEQPPILSMGQSYIAVNEKIKSPYKVKQIQKRLNDIRNGYFQGGENEINYFQSNKTMYLD